jgi:AcrR family transcriptional regulator
MKMEAVLAPGELRMQEILERIRPVVSAKGFEGSSMQDLSHAAGMSAGNFYRYFPSKAAIIKALVQRDLEEAEKDFDAIRQAVEPRKAMREIVRKHVENTNCDAQLRAEICAAASRKPEIAAMLEHMERQVLNNIVDVFARIAGIGEAEAHRRFATQARLIMLLIQGLSLMTSHSTTRDQQNSDRDLAALVVQTIDEIVERMLAGVRREAPVSTSHLHAQA